MVSIRSRLTTLAAAAGLLATVAVTTSTGTAGAATACESWSGVLKSGSRGAGVTELQIRVAGWVPSGQVMAADGVYGEQTLNAVKRFQSAYGLGADGVAGADTFAKLRSLTSADCTPIHFTYAEASNNCGKGFTGGATEKANLRRSLWQAEAMRKRLGDRPLKITSGYRDPACDREVGGSGSGQHTTGKAIDFVPLSGHTMCGIAVAAKSGGYGGIFGPGYPGHSDHVHGDWRTGKSWSAGNCAGF